MWDGHLDQICIAKHKIKIVIKSKPRPRGTLRRCIRRTRVPKYWNWENFLSKCRRAGPNKMARTYSLCTKKELMSPVLCRLWGVDHLTCCNSCPISCMDSSIGLVGEATFFSTLDANNGNWHAEVKEENNTKHKLPLVTVYNASFECCSVYRTL